MRFSFKRIDGWWKSMESDYESILEQIYDK